MKSVALANFPFVGLTVIALVLFALVFLGFVVWTFRKESSKIYKHAENLPLEGEEHV
jgi:cbb3-type cytochrome oxidase subunit 3